MLVVLSLGERYRSLLFVVRLLLFCQKRQYPLLAPSVRCPQVNGIRMPACI